MRLIIAEKHSVARAIAQAIGGERSRTGTSAARTISSHGRKATSSTSCHQMNTRTGVGSAGISQRFQLTRTPDGVGNYHRHTVPHASTGLSTV